MEFWNSSPFNSPRNPFEETVAFAESFIFLFRKIYIDKIYFFERLLPYLFCYVNFGLTWTYMHKSEPF